MTDFLNPDVIEIARLALEAARSSNWALVVALALVAAVWAVRKLVAPKVPFFNTDPGAVLLTFVGSGAGALASSLLAGAVFDGELVLTAVKVALIAAGGFVVVVKKLGPWVWAWLKSFVGPKLKVVK